MNEFGSLVVRWIQGFANRNTVFVENKTVCYICGNHICFLNLETRTQNAFPSPGRGIGTLTANGNSGIFAFSEEKLSPSIFVYTFPELQLKNELKGGAQLDYTSLALSHNGPYLGSCSSLPDHIITVWNWENAEPLCSQPQAGQDVVYLAFNPMNWLQLCALGTTSLTVWNIMKSDDLHVLQPSVIKLPAPDGTFAESQAPSSQNVSNIMAKLHQSTRATLTPSAICWTATSKLYVGCAEGFLLLVDPESHSVSVLFNPTSADAIPELKRNSFQCLTPNKNGLIAVGKERVAHLLQIKGTRINITQTWQLERPITTMMYSPDYKTLLFSSNTGQIYVLNPAQTDRIVKIFDVLSGNFVTATLLHNDKNICVSLKESGELQLWSSDGICISSLSLQAEVTCLACCPIAHCAAVGTATGKVLFIDLNQEQRPRLVHQVLLYHAAVDHLVFDNDGHYVFTSGSDSHIYVLEARPSKMFSVIGYTVLPGYILSLSAQCNRDNNEVKVLALCAGEEDRKKDGSLLTVLSLLTQNLAGPDSIDRHGCLSSHVLKVVTFRVPRPLKSCVLGVSEIFAYCHGSKTLQRFVLPEDKEDVSDQQAVELKPVQEVRGHPLGPVSLALSPHSLWLASVGRDGLLRIRETASMERYIELQCHSYRLGGVRSVSFSADGSTVLTVGLRDDSLVCTHIRVKGGDVSKMNETTQYSKSTAHLLKNIFDTENPILINFPVWGQVSPVGTETPEVSGGPFVDVTERDGGNNNLLRAPPLHPTWLESRREGLLKEDQEQYSEMKRNMMETIKELRNSIQEMIHDSENQPEHFNLDAEEERRLEAMVEQEVTRVRTKIEWDILEKCYLRDALKRECWDTMKVISRTIKAFHSDLEVLNYPLKERTEKELEVLCRVQNIRKLEKAACSLSSLKKDLCAQDKEKKNVQEAKSTTVTGSISAQLGYSVPYIYDQFSLKTIEQRTNQIVLLQDVIYRIKTAFNADFDALHKQKMQELKHVRDRNKHIREIMLQLDVDEELWEPGLTNSEWPERLLTVEDSEIKAERYLTEEQKEEEERRKLEEERRLAAQADDSRERGLDDMMEGVLQVKKEDILKMEIPPPEFVLTKPDIQWSEEEKKAFKEYEKKAKELSEEKEKYQKLLEIEIKKLHQSTKEATERFDENLAKLLEKKVNCTVAIYQEELKITYLVESVLREEEMRSQEQELKLKLEKMLAYKDESGERLKKLEEEVELLQETYDNIVLDDKSLDKDFRKVFVDLPSNMFDYLYKMFKRRPRAQKMRAQMNNSNNSDLFKEHRLCGSQAPDALSQMLRAMDELDAPANMPEGLSMVAWEIFCHIRRAKIVSEQKVKTKALTLAEMQAFLQKRRNEDKASQEEIKNLSEALESLHRKRTDLLMDTMVQVILKQGQVERTTTGPTADNADTNVILYHRSVVDNLRSVIRTLAEQKIASMVARKDVRKGMIQLEWEHKVMRKQIEDLNNKAKNIKMLQLSEEQQKMTLCSKSDQESHTSKQISSLEKTIALMETAHKKSVQQRLRKIEQLNKRAATKAKKSADLEQQLPEMQVAVSELRHIYEAAASVENEAAGREERYREIVKKSRLKELARAQAENLAFLREEVERLTMKNFPSLDQLKH